MDRRKFVKNASVAGTSFLLAPQLGKASGFFKGSPNDKVVLGMMGTHSRGLYLAQNFSKIPNTEIGFVCDVDSNVVESTIADIYKRTGKKPEGFTDCGASKKLVPATDAFLTNFLLSIFIFVITPILFF